MTSRKLSAPLLVALCALSCGAPPVAPRTTRPLVAPVVEKGSIDILRLMGDAPKRAIAQGAGPSSIVASGLVAEGERLGAFVEATDDTCLVAYARGSTSVEDLDLFALTDDGSPIALDEGPDPRPAVLVCPPHPRRFYLALQAATGEGLAVLVAHNVPRARAKAVAIALGARGAFGAPKRAEMFPGLDDAVREHRRVLGGAWEESKRGNVLVDTQAPSYVAVTAAAGDCFDLLLFPNDEVGLVDADLLDDEGRQVARARGAGETRSIVVCSEETFTGTLRLRSHVGQGACAYVLSRSAASFAKEAHTRPEVVLHGVPLPLADAEKARSEALTKAGYAVATTTTRGALTSAKITTRYEELRAPCSRIDLVGGAPLRRSVVEVWSTQGSLLGEGDGLLGGVAFACAKGRVRIDLEGRGSGGPYALSVRPVPWVGPELTASPLAASRMLSRASRGPHELFEGSAAGLHSLPLSSTSLAGFTEDVAPGACLSAHVGIEGVGQGVTLRAADGATGEELDRAHGELAAGVSVCAAARALKVRFEVRLSSGTATAIVGLRKL